MTRKSLQITVGRVEDLQQKLEEGLGRWDTEFWADQLDVLVKRLETGKWSLNSGCTSWKPLSGRCWEAGDGSKLIKTLVELLLGWFDRGMLECLDCDEQFIVETLLIRHCDQHDYEGLVQ